jgi:indolepyruvate ferredoxin oxidoreductase, alpha subunit
MPSETLMGDEAIALGALHAGITAAFAYPGTPSTEIMEYLQDHADEGGIVAQWCTNEKTAYEAALGVSFAGRRALVSMKHVGLNVAADPFINSGLLKINGGLVLVVADDPGMHSSQDEQDSRFYAEFARVPCLEPADQQEAYAMVREAFDLSERAHSPVLFRITTRLAHSRAGVETQSPRAQNKIHKADDRWGWTLMPQAAKALWKALIPKYESLRAESEKAAFVEPGAGDFGVVTTGLALEYYRENSSELEQRPYHLHIGRYPMPYGALRDLAHHAKRILVIEEGYPFVERYLRGVLDSGVMIYGKETGELPADGELDPDIVRKALGLPARPAMSLPAGSVVPPKRPPQLCQGCPHADSYSFLNEALEDYPQRSVNSDIGCYTLGAMPPHNAIESCVDMGASMGMARGAAEAGITPAVAVIGDSTFYHSGLTNLIDIVSHNSNVKVLILDNSTTAMTGAQPTILPSERLRRIVAATGVPEEHIHVLNAHKNDHEKNVAIMKAELAYEGPSVIISARTCLEAAKKARKA